MKAYTDLSQSKKLAEILPLESADMGYIPSAEDDDGNTLYTAEFKSEIIFDKVCIPCWSLAALLDILSNGNMLVKTTDGKYYCLAKDVMTKHYDNPVNACYEMIIKLKEKEKL